MLILPVTPEEAWESLEPMNLRSAWATVRLSLKVSVKTINHDSTIR
jgi:hypothetical protein